MKECKDCKFLGLVSNSMTWCNYLEGYVQESELKCKWRVPDKIPCSCGENSIWLVDLDKDSERFSCDTCLDGCRMPMSVILLDNIIPTELLKIYKKINKISTDYKAMVNSLSKKQMDTYNFILELGGAVLVRSLDDTQRGCLGKLVSDKLGEIGYINQHKRKFKVFRLDKGVLLNV